jgi:hypothetical protein
VGKIKIWENGVSYYADSAVAVGYETIYTGCMKCGRMIPEDDQYCSLCWRELSPGEKESNRKAA